jgi:hypothetical protein
MTTNENRAGGRKGPTDRSSKAQQSAVIRGLLALLGLGLVGTGVAAIFTTKSDAGAATLVGVGSLLVLFAVLGDQLESLQWGGFEAKLRDKANEYAIRGDLETAEVLNHAADIVGQRVATAAHTYRSVRTTMPPGAGRIREMDKVLEAGKSDADTLDIDEEDVLRRLWTGSEGARVWALGFLQKRPELATPRIVLDAIKHPDEMYDQYNALVLAEMFVQLENTRTWQRERVAHLLRFQLDHETYGTDAACIKKANKILEYLSSRS